MTNVAAHLAARRRRILADGGAATLRRQTQVNPPLYTTVTLKARAFDFNPDEAREGLRQANRRVEILAEEITAAAWPAPPKNGDSLVTTEGTLAILGAAPVTAGGTTIGYRLFCRAAT